MQDAICEESFRRKSEPNVKAPSQEVSGARFAIALAGLITILALTLYEMCRYLLN
ncbi:MAG: hypothetical protein LAO03_15275 [Acidobacteriia bacterium]|nr:hypothetical protein [Terriglobia bacterium]